MEIVIGVVVGALVAAVLLLAVQRSATTPGTAADQPAPPNALSAEDLAAQQAAQLAAQQATQQAALAAAVAPVAQRLNELGELVRTLERERAQDHGSLRQQLEGLTGATAALQSETTTLSTALRDVRTRGMWGEVQLRRVVELAGMIEHCDFTEQTHTAGDEATLRPDLIVHLPEGGAVVIDAKVPLGSYLQAVEATDAASTDAHLAAHAKAVAAHVNALAKREYDRHVPGAIDFVVLFVPGDVFLSAAFEARPDLFEEAARQHVLLATPTTLIALLRAVHQGWRQAQLAASAQEVADLGAELHDRLTTFVDHLAKTGKALDTAVRRYNDAVGSLDARVLVTARKLGEHGVRSRELPSPEPIERLARQPADAAEGLLAESTGERRTPAAEF